MGIQKPFCTREKFPKETRRGEREREIVVAVCVGTYFTMASDSC